MVEFIMMCGLPGAGKSQFTQNASVSHNAVIHSSDAIRKEMFGNESYCPNQVRVFKELHSRIKNSLRNGESAIYDATNIHYKRRKAFLDELKSIDCKKICYLIATPYEQCVEQNATRERNVPQKVIERMYKHFYIPQKYEGWDEIRIIWSDNLGDTSLPYEVDDFNQDNPYHSLTLGAHLRKCSNIVGDSDRLLQFAAFLHDIGKPFTKGFVDSYGDPSCTAHYYQHHLVGAYNSMFYLKNEGFSDSDILEVCNYIQWHMLPYLSTSKKFINMVGTEFYHKLMILHEADKLAH